MPSQSVQILRPYRIQASENVTMASEEDFREKIDEPIATNARGIYSGYQRLFLACSDYD